MLFAYRGEPSVLRNNNVLLAIPIGQGVPQVTPDLGLAFLATALRESGFQVSILDCQRNGFCLGDFEEYLRANDFSVVGLKIFSTELEVARQMLDAVQLMDSSTLTLLGGPHPSGSPGDVLVDIGQADYAFCGEAEIGLPRLLKHVADGSLSPGALSEIPGLIFRDNGAAQTNPPGRVQDLDELGMPAWDLIDPRDYRRHEKLWAFQKRRIVAPLHIVRGCPYECGFCACHTITGRKVRFRGLDLVMRELRVLYEKYDVREFQIVDDFFSADRDYVLEFCERFKKEDLDMLWCCPHGLRLDSLDAELLHAMEDAGCYGTSVGIESGSQRILDFIKKRLTTAVIREKIELIANETNWIIQGSFILGFPTETRQEIFETIKFADSLALDNVLFTGFRVYKGTPLYDYLKDKNENGDVDYSILDAYKIEYAPDGMTIKELSSMIRGAYWKFFCKPSRLFTLLKHMHSPGQIRMLLQKIKWRMFN